MHGTIIVRILVVSTVLWINHNGDQINGMLAWFSKIEHIKWFSLEVKNFIFPGSAGSILILFMSSHLNWYFSGVMVNFKGFVYFFSSSLEYEGAIGHLVVATDNTLEFIPLPTKLPLKNCQRTINGKCEHVSTNETCRCIFDKHQVLSFPIYMQYSK